MRPEHPVALPRMDKERDLDVLFTINIVYIPYIPGTYIREVRWQYVVRRPHYFRIGNKFFSFEHSIFIDSFFIIGC